MRPVHRRQRLAHLAPHRQLAAVTGYGDRVIAMAPGAMMAASPLNEPAAEKLPSIPEHASPMPWAEARRRLEAGRIYWLATRHPSGRPQVRPILGLWLEGGLYFVAGPGSRKARNLALDPRCSVALETTDAHLVVEGTAAVVRDDATLAQAAAAYADKYQWYVRIEDGAFDADYAAPTAGPLPVDVYQLLPARVFGFGTGDTGLEWTPTRWRFRRSTAP